MKQLFVLGIFVALLFLIGCTEDTIQTSPTPQENKVVDAQKTIPNKENPNLTKKEESPVILKEEPPIATPPILTKQEPILPKESSLIEDTLFYISFIEELLDKYASIDSNIYHRSIGSFSSNKITKQDLCVELNSQKDAIKELYQNSLEKKSSNLMLFKEGLDKLKDSISENLNQLNTLLAKDISSFCSNDGSILLLDKIKDNLLTYSIRLDDISRSLYKIKQHISKNPTAQKIAHVGDSIEKGGMKVTLRKVTKNYVSWQCYYNQLRDSDDSDIFTDEEWKDIQKYQNAISYSPELSEKLYDELNQKYGKKVEDVDLKFLYLDWGYEITDQKLAKENLATRLQEEKRELQEIFRSGGSVYTGIVGYNNIAAISLYKENSPSFNPREYHNYYCSDLEKGGTYFSNWDLEWDLEGVVKEINIVYSGEIKVIIDFSSCVRNSAINIQHTEQGLICDNAYIFTVNLDD